MLPYEVVVRREAHGSYLKRNPHLAKGQLFPQLIVEFYLKTKDKNWKGKPLVADDPLMQYADGAEQIKLFNPAKPLLGAGAVPGAADDGRVQPRRRMRNSFPRCGASRARLSSCWRKPGSSKAARWSISRSSSASTAKATCCSPT